MIDLRYLLRLRLLRSRHHDVPVADHHRRRRRHPRSGAGHDGDQHHRAYDPVRAGVGGTEIFFEAAMIIAMLGFVSTVAYARFMLRGNIIE